jgi:pyruvate dehydrogenase E2 component (dihydrolipoamide acetyltransferase)
MDALNNAVNLREVRIPELGAVSDMPVLEVLVQPGERIARNTPLLVLESEKAALDVPAPADGVVKELKIKVGDKVSAGSLVLLLEPSESVTAAVEPTHAPNAITPEVDSATDGTAAALTAPEQAPLSVCEGAHASVPIAASPAVRKFARALGADLARVSATGPNGRVLSDDVERFVRAELARPVPRTAPSSPAELELPPSPQIDFSSLGPVDRRLLSRIRRIAGAHLARSWIQIPHVTNFDEADITELETFRSQLNQEKGKDGAKLTMLAFLIKASAVTLQRYREFNASLDGEELVYKRYFHIGFACDTPNGLVVPVIRDVDLKGLLQIAREAGELAALARAGKLRPQHIQGGCFSISSLGGIGGTGFTPIINAPEVAILGVVRSEHKPKWDGTQFRPRLMLPLCLSWDHRVVDGAAAARFLVHLGTLLSDFRRVSL